MARFPDDPRAGNELELAFRDIRVQGAPQVFYEVYLNLPADARDTVYTSPHYAGNIDFFGPSARGAAGTRLQDRVLSILPTYVRLRALRRWPDADLRLTLVPRAYVENEQPARLLGTRVQAEIGRVLLLVR